MSSLPEPVAVIGGTGQFGRGFCRHLARAGVSTLIGSRRAERARAAADSLDGEGLSGSSNDEALQRAGTILLTLPFSARDALLQPHAGALRGKTVVDTTVPLDPESLQYDPPEAGSAALELDRWLEDDSVDLVSGFHSLGAHALEQRDTPPVSDVFYCGDPEGKRRVRALLKRLGWSGHDAGELARSATLERMAPLMIHFNRRYERPAMGLKLVDEGG